MRIQAALFIVVSALLTGFLFGVLAGDQDKLTHAAEATLKKLYPNAEVADVDEREKHDEEIFVVRLHEGPNRRDVILELARDGQLLEIDEDVPVDNLPGHIKHAVKKAFPKGDIRHGEMETEMNITYRVDVEDGRKKRRIKLSRTGKIHEIEKRD